MPLAHREQPSFFAVGQRLGVQHHRPVQCFIGRAADYGAWRRTTTERLIHRTPAILCSKSGSLHSK
jgi:hypothetical protein